MKIPLLLGCISLTSCSFYIQKSDPPEMSAKSPRTSPQKPELDPGAVQRARYLQEPLVQAGVHNNWIVHICAEQSKAMERSSVPVFAAGNSLGNRACLLQLDLPISFYEKLPNEIQKTLQEQGIAAQKTEIAMCIQAGISGDRKPWSDKPESHSQVIYFYPHGWAFAKGETGKKNLLQGIFAPSNPLLSEELSLRTDAIALNQLHPAEVEICIKSHPKIGEYEVTEASPQKLVMVQKGEQAFSFWSIVVDPAGEKRAIATFHWYIPSEFGQAGTIQDLTVSPHETRKKSKYVIDPGTQRWIVAYQPYMPSVATFGAWLERVTATDGFYVHPPLKKIGDEVRSWFGLPPISVPDPIQFRPDAHAGDHHADRFAFLETPYAFIENPNPYINGKTLSNMRMTAHYGTSIAPVTILADYPTNGKGSYTQEYVVMGLPMIFEKALPSALLAALHSQGISSPDMAIVIGDSREIGEYVDHEDGSPLTSQLRAHGWADPYVPAHYTGTRVNRDFLYGIFEPSTLELGREEVPVGRLAPFNLHVHDGLFSPRTARIGIPSFGTTFSFWSLVVDTLPAENGGRGAIATWHIYMPTLPERVAMGGILSEICKDPQISSVYPCGTDLKSLLARMARSKLLMENMEFHAFFQKLLTFFAVTSL